MAQNRKLLLPRKVWEQFVEDCVPANAIGTGAHVAGLVGDPPVGKKRKIKVQRRKKP
jgi:hypothetical protein